MNDEMRINIAIVPTWETVKTVLDRATAFLTDKGQSDDFISATSMCVTELIENAVKYGTETPAGEAISFDLALDERRIKIKISNGIRGETDLGHVSRIIDSIRDTDDPQKLYVDRLRELIEDPRPGMSQLGLYRIAYEGRFDLAYSFQNGVLTIDASRDVS